MKRIFVIGKAFSNSRPDGEHIAFVFADGTVRMDDPVSGTLTNCHALTAEQEATVRNARENSTIALA